MATRSSILAWNIPWTEQPGGLQSIRLQRVRYDRVHTHTHKSKNVFTTYYTPPWVSTSCYTLFVNGLNVMELSLKKAFEVQRR